MPNSEGNSSKAKKSGNFVWSDDEVRLLLNVVLEYKTARSAENVDWQICQTKYTDILDLLETCSKCVFFFDASCLTVLRLQFALRATTEGERYSYASLYTRRCANLASQYLNE